MDNNGRTREPVPNIRETPGYIVFLDTPLGQGATSKVYGGRHKKSGKRVACKVPHGPSVFRMGTDMERESQVLLRLRHKNIVSLEAIEKDEVSKENILVMELCTGGSLFDVLEKPEHSCGLKEKDFLQVLADITSGMKYLRDNGVVHRDVKPGNIMCFKDDHGHTIYKLADFGAARQLEDDENFTSLHGTEEYLHPRVFERAVLKKPATCPFDARIDLWSIGATLYHVATGQLPFRPQGGRKNSQMMYHLTSKKAPGVISGVQTGPGEHEIIWSRELPESCCLSPGLKKLITPLLAGLLECNPRTAWSFQQFFEASQSITSKTVIHLWVCDASYIKVYCSPTDTFAQFQEHIASQTKLSANRQSILCNGVTLKPDGTLRISQCRSPIILCNKEQVHIPHHITPPSDEMPWSANTLTQADLFQQPEDPQVAAGQKPIHPTRNETDHQSWLDSSSEHPEQSTKHQRLEESIGLPSTLSIQQTIGQQTPNQPLQHVGPIQSHSRDQQVNSPNHFQRPSQQSSGEPASQRTTCTQENNSAMRLPQTRSGRRIHKPQKYMFSDYQM